MQLPHLGACNAALELLSQSKFSKNVRFQLSKKPDGEDEYP